ncbi:HD domain-containing phosphohydrolase [Streptomyces sp. CB03911]|uniref:HD-GYP domain-containing protein n=1 Tax=Streptomyces sp. CB03911 TaxID=1804758 RepID=UPI002570E5FB|nr:HD domain-containing phosphohydrolase [Streptomyces sp. CB03911]
MSRLRRPLRRAEQLVPRPAAGPDTAPAQPAPPAGRAADGAPRRPRGAGAVPAVLHTLAAALLVAAVAATAAAGVAQPLVATAFLTLIAVGECVRITLPGDREQAPIGAAAALAYALLGPLRGLPTTHGVLQVVAVAGAGSLLAATAPVLSRALPGACGLALRRRRGRPWGDPVRRDTAARRLLTVGFAAAVFQPLYNGGLLDRLPSAGPAYGVFLAAVAALAALCDATLAAALHRARTGLRFPAALEDELRSLPGIGSAIVATGMLVSLAAGEIGLWALPVFCAPLLLAQVSFRRAAAIRATTGQTIATLARATEVAGYTPPGHARRVADTACALGRELGLGTRELALLEYAALMHDVGQLSLVEPVPDGATALLPAAEQQRIARLGSEVIRRTGVPPRVAEQVARLADPCRRPDGGLDPSLPLSARIIRVANAHDDLLTAARGRGLSDPAGRLEALEALRLERGRAYDPRVVEALARMGGRAREPG